MIVTSADCACAYKANKTQLPLVGLLHILENWHG